MSVDWLVALLVACLSCLGFATLMLPAGLVSFGHALYAALGAWAAAGVLREAAGGGWLAAWPLEALPLAGGAAAAAAAAVFSLVTARHAGAAFAMISLGLAEAAAQWAMSTQRLGGEGGWSLNRGSMGSVLGTVLPLESAAVVIGVGLLCLAMTGAVLVWALRGQRVLMWAALRDDADRFQALGHSAWAWRSALLVLGAFPLGLAATVQVLWVERFSAAAWHTEHSVWLMVFGVLGVAGVQRLPWIQRAPLAGQVLAAGGLGGLFMATAQQVLPRLSSAWPLCLGLVFLAVCAGTQRRATAQHRSSSATQDPPQHRRAVCSPQAALGEELVRLDRVDFSYGQVAVLRGLSLALHRGECVALVGPNGAGKSSLFEVLSARYQAQTGQQWWRGRAWPAHSVPQRARSGVARSFQGSRLFDSLTPAEHLALLPRAVARNAAWEGLRAALGLTSDWHRPVAALGSVPQRAVELLLTLSQEADLVLLDEPTAGLNPAQTRAWVAALATWRQQQPHQAWLLIEHDASVVQSLADRVLHLHEGRLQSSLPEAARSAELDSAPPALRSALGPPRLLAPTPGGRVALQAGECLAVLGPQGSGRSRWLAACMGLAPSIGPLWLEGQDLSAADAATRGRAGLAWVPEDRGLWPDLSVADHLRLAQASRPGWPPIDLHQDFPALAQRLKVPAAQLSGGERQMLALARAAALHHRVVLLDEPSEGLSPAALKDTQARLQAWRRRGTVVVLTEQKLSLAPHLADQVLLMDRGQVVWQGTVTPGAWPTELLAHLRVLGITSF